MYSQVVELHNRVLSYRVGFNRWQMTSHSDVRGFEWTLVALALFSAFVVYYSDPSGFGPFFIGAVAYLASLALVIAGLGLPKGRRLTYLTMTIILAPP